MQILQKCLNFTKIDSKLRYNVPIIFKKVFGNVRIQYVLTETQPKFYLAFSGRQDFLVSIFTFEGRKYF